MSGDWTTVIAVAITAAGAWLTARMTTRAQDKKAKAEQEVGAGQLALNIATGLQTKLDETVAKVDSDRKTNRKVFNRIRAAWSEHLVWDDHLLDLVEEHDPEARKKMTPRPELPLDELDEAL